MIATRQQAIRAAINLLRMKSRECLPGRGKSALLNAVAQLQTQLYTSEAPMKSLIGIMKTKPQRGGKYWLRTGPLGPKIPNFTSKDKLEAALLVSGR